MTAASNPDFGLLDGLNRQPAVRTVLPNGAVVLVQEDFSAPVVSAQVWVRTGSIHEAELLGSGASHFVEHMLFKGTARRAGREISAEVQAHGGHINAYTTFDRTVYYIDAPAEHLGVALDILSDAVLHSTIPEGEFGRERDVILREIDMGRDDPEHRFSELLFDTAFRTHPFRHPIIGHRDVYAALSHADLVGYYRRRYVPNNLVVVIAGAVRAAEAGELCAKHFGTVPRSRLEPVVPPGEPLALAPRRAERFEDVDLSRTALAWPTPDLTHPDAVALDLLAGVLGGGESTDLWQRLRERERLVHAIDAFSWTPAGPGLFSVSYTCEAEKREAAAAAARAVIADRLARGFTDAEIRRAQRQLIVSEINSRKTMAGQAGRLGTAETAAGDIEYTRSYFVRLATIDSAELCRVGRLYLDSAREIFVSQNPLSAAPAAPQASTASADRSLEFERFDLPNGARLLVQQNTSLPLVHLRVGFLGGALAELPGKRGSTALLSTLLTKDTRTRSALEVAEAIEAVGGSFHPFNGNNSFGIAAEVLSSDVDVALALVREAIDGIAFAPQTFDIEREAQIAALRQDDDDNVSVARRLLRQSFFGDHPLAVEPSGRVKDLVSLAVADLELLWRRCAVAGNVVAVLAGNFDRGAVLPRLRDWLASLPAGEFKASVVPVQQIRSQELHELLEREQAVVMQAFPGPGIHEDDYYVSEVADELFSGMSSRLFERVREEKGLAYFVRSARTVGVDRGMFAFLAGTHPSKAAEVMAEMEAEIARVAAGDIGDAELARCLTRLKAGRRMGLQTNGSRAMLALTNTLYGYPVNDWLRYDERIDSVSKNQLQAFAASRLRPALRVQLIVGPGPAPSP